MIFFFLPLFSSSQDVTFTKVASGDLVSDGGWNYAMAWADFNGDNYPDLFVTNNDSDNDKFNFLYFNNGDGTFEKITEGPVTTDGGSSYSCTAADIDGDYDMDLFVANHNENNFLYLGNGNGTFQKVTEGDIVNDGGKSVGASWIDYDLDGYTDLFVANRDQPNFLYHGTGPGYFEKITMGNIVTESANTSGCAWGDYDNDGYPDLYVANSGSASKLYHNDFGTFTEVEEEPFTSDISSCSGASWGDCDNDGDLDLFVSTGQLGMYNNWFYKNNGDGSFTKITDSPVVNEATWSSGSAWGDYDKDGDLDLAVGGYDGDNQLFSNDGNGNFIAVSDNAFVNDGGYTKGLAWADADDDGDLDIFTAKNNFFGGNNSFFLNDGNENNWLKVKPTVIVCCVNSSNAYGVRVYVYATIFGQAVMQMREASYQSGGGQGGENEAIEFFGLGDASVVDSVIVSWSGVQSKAYNVSSNQTIEMGPVIGSITDNAHRRNPLINVFPNPSSGVFQIDVNTKNEQGILYITTLDGRSVLQKTLLPSDVRSPIKMNPKELGMKRGTYFILFKGQENIDVAKFVLTPYQRTGICGW
jgi:hypothetical protein